MFFQKPCEINMAHQIKKKKHASLAFRSFPVQKINSCFISKKKKFSMEDGCILAPEKTGGISCENIIIWSFGRGTPCKFRVAQLPAAEASHKKNPRMRLTRRLKRLRRCLGMSFVKKLVDVGGL